MHKIELKNGKIFTVDEYYIEDGILFMIDGKWKKFESHEIKSIEGKTPDIGKGNNIH